MAIRRYAGDVFVGLSTDIKPTDVADGARFYEKDSPCEYLKVNGSWISLCENSVVDVPISISSFYNTLTEYSIGPSSTTKIEIGKTVNVTKLDWSLSKPAVSASLSQGIGALSPSVLTYTHNDTYSSDRSYILTVEDASSNIDTQTTYIKFCYPFYCGTNSNSTINSSQILSLSNSELRLNKNTSITLDGNGEYIYFSYPVIWGLATVYVNGFLNTAWDIQTVSHTNSSGYTSDYYTYRSTYIQNGTDISVEIS